jgi:FKBP-type peptidyl-prolyl cis-trans isomerase FklB
MNNKVRYLLPLGFIAFAHPLWADVNLSTELSKTSYAIGTKYGESIKQDLPDLELPSLIEGIKAGHGDSKIQLTPEQVTQLLTQYQQTRAQKMQAEQGAASEKNLKEGQAFLEKNAKDKEVKTTASGLQYKIIKAGTGAKPGLEDTVKVHYHGTLVDGTVFDSSIERGEPISFPVNGVIKGWTEALQLMPAGSEWQLYIPANLAYGEEGTRGKIGPNATLIFKVQLLEVIPANALPAAHPALPTEKEPAAEKPKATK